MMELVSMIFQNMTVPMNQFVPSSPPSIHSKLNPNSNLRTSARLSDVTEECAFSTTDMSSCLHEIVPGTPDRKRRFYKGEFMCNDEFQFGLTLDGFLAICHSGVRVYEKGLDGNTHYVQFQHDGNLVAYRKRDEWSYKATWATSTENNGSTLRLNNDGKVIMKNMQGYTIWKAEPVVPVTPFPTISPAPTFYPTSSPAPSFSLSPTSGATYNPGKLVFDSKTGVYISEGLTIRLVAQSDRKVIYENGQTSHIPFHKLPDAATCIPKKDGKGWHYLVNSEVNGGDVAKGGVGQIAFGASGEVEKYSMALTGTKMNCGGGKTPWNTFISCEEIGGGKCWEIHPEKEWPARATVMGGNGGKFESAAFDARDMNALKGFVTHDNENGELRRFTPHSATLMRAIKSGDYRDVLHTQGGLIEYLVLHPSFGGRRGTYSWTTNIHQGRNSAAAHFPNAEGIDFHDGFLYFVSKKTRRMIVLDLDSNTYVSSPTNSGPFNGQPDQVMHILPTYPHMKSRAPGLIYFTEDGGGTGAGIYARDKNAKQMYTIVKGGPGFTDETTGLAFCDDNKRMMFAFQDEGKLYELRREDNLPFYGNTVDVKYHQRVFDEKLP